MSRHVFTSTNVVLPNQAAGPATVIVDTDTGKVIEIRHTHASRSDFLDITDEHWTDAGENYILPGLVDAHVHLNEPGRTDWEGFWTGTRAALSGGVTTVVDMPLNSIPPTTTVENLALKRAAARDQCWTDVAFWGGVIPGNENDLRPLIESGVKGFKCFLIESGVEEFPCVSEEDVRKAMSKLNDTPAPLLFHAELDTHPHSFKEANADPAQYSTFLHSRPQQLERDAISLVTSLQPAFPNVRCHIVHLSASSAIPIIRRAKASGLSLTVETCFHYLCLAAGDIPSGRPEFKCCPPIREDDNRDLLWEALKDGTIDCVVSDHSPCVADLKRLDDGNIMEAWGGISTLGLGLSLLWTEGAKYGVGIEKIVEWTSSGTAQHAGLTGSKGQLAVGFDADVVVFDPHGEFNVTKESLNFKNKLSPYEGKQLRGRVLQTFLGGKLAWEGGFDNRSPMGRLL